MHCVSCERMECVTQRSTLSTKLSSSPSSAWWGFTNYTDRQCIEAFVRRGIRCGFCCSDNKTIQQLVEESDQSLFKRVLTDNYHVLNCLLADERHYCYNLHDRAHNRELHITSRLLDCNFLGYSTAFYRCFYSCNSYVYVQLPSDNCLFIKDCD